MTRWAAGVEYLGSGFAGWQFQEHSPSLQGEVERALASVAAHPVEVVCAGRTDAGVHAWQQVIHFDSPAQRSAYAWLLGTNSRLPDRVSLRWVQAVPETFHARHRALARRYRYVVHNARARSALLAERAAWIKFDLDAEAMHRAAQHLLGERDFSAFRDSGCQSLTAMRELSRIGVRRAGAFVVFDLCANAFLHHMVRNIVGTLFEVGQGRRPESWIAEVLESRDRTRAGLNAPPHGLYFIGAEYPAEFAIPEPPEFWLGG